MPRSHMALGVQGAEAAKQARRNAIEQLSVRPSPGSSDLLHRPLSSDCVGGVGPTGRIRTMIVYDLLGLAPVHLKR